MATANLLSDSIDTRVESPFNRGTRANNSSDVPSFKLPHAGLPGNTIKCSSDDSFENQPTKLVPASIGNFLTPPTFSTLEDFDSAPLTATCFTKDDTRSQYSRWVNASTVSRTGSLDLKSWTDFVDQQYPSQDQGLLYSPDSWMIQQQALNDKKGRSLPLREPDLIVLSGLQLPEDNATTRESSVFSHTPTPKNLDKPLRCDQCWKSFTRNHDLKRHQRRHMGVKGIIVTCHSCGRGFTRKDLLKVHMLSMETLLMEMTDDSHSDTSKRMFLVAVGAPLHRELQRTVKRVSKAFQGVVVVHLPYRHIFKQHFEEL